MLASADDARGGSPDANRSVPSDSDSRLFRIRQLEQLLLNVEQLLLNERRLQSTNLLDGKNQYPQLQMAFARPAPLEMSNGDSEIWKSSTTCARSHASTATPRGARLESSSGTGVGSSLFGLWAH